MDKLELQTRLEAALNEQKRWENLDLGMAAYHEGRADAFKQCLEALTRGTTTANAEMVLIDIFKKLGVAIRGLKSNKSKQ